MSYITVKNNQIPLKAYLRADSFSQHFQICYDDGIQEELVNDEMFWGNKDDDRLYIDYSSIKNRRIKISEGISQGNGTQTFYNSDCDNWINKNILNNKSSKLFIVYGYAGCGKTTFMNHIIRNKPEESDEFYVDIGHDWSYSLEPQIFFKETLSAFRDCLSDIKKRNTRDKIWKKFIEFGSASYIKELDLLLPDIILNFDRQKKNCNWNELCNILHTYLNEHFENNIDYDKFSDIQAYTPIVHNRGQIETIVSLIILLICAKASVENEDDPSKRAYTLIFDNLDIITNPAIPAENVLSLWGVIHRYILYKKMFYEANSKKLPNITLLITVRKVLYSHITAHLPNLEMPMSFNPYLVNICDISDLYCFHDILNHRISYWKNHLHDTDVINKLTQLKDITEVHINTELTNFQEQINTENEYSTKNMINFDAFFNHNYRAFSNVFSAIFDEEKYSSYFKPDLSSNSYTKNWRKVSSLIFAISSLYKKGNVWSKMGFGCNNYNLIDYPTTLNRLILNNLYISKCGQALNDYAEDRNDIPMDDYVSLNDIINLFKRTKLFTIDTTLNKRQIDKKYMEAEFSETTEFVLERLAYMCARNPKNLHSQSYGYDSDDDELWRRPLYFVGGVKLNHTAATNKELKAYFKYCIDNNKADQVLFSITDEGFVLIHDIVASFEFYSARYCNESSAKPLHQSTSENEINNLITPVYRAVKLCCERHKIFMENYIQQYKIDKNKYLKQKFHPRTRPKFKNQSNYPKKLRKTSFRPQLHIVRVIYSHIGYFDDVKDYVSNSDISEKDTMCKCITEWIEKYLDLYNNYFYYLLEDTECNPDNNVYITLQRMLNKQKKHYKNKKNINIRIST